MTSPPLRAQTQLRRTSRAATAENLEELRRLAKRYGAPIEMTHRLTLRPREVAEMTGFSLRTVERWIQTGRLGSIRVDRSIAVALQDLLQFLEQNRHVPTLASASSLQERAAAVIRGVPRSDPSG